MRDKTFVDTSILIWAHDIDDRSKHEVAKRILSELWNRRTGALSVQTLQEFCVNVTRKIAARLPKHTARTVVHSYATWCVETTPADLSLAVEIEDESKIGFWTRSLLPPQPKAEPSGSCRTISMRDRGSPASASRTRFANRIAL